MAEPVLRLHLDDLSHPGNALFLSQVDISRLLPNALSHIVKYLYTPCHGSKLPETRSVTLVLRPFQGVAYTEGLRLDDAHKEIHFNLNYIQNLKDKPTQCRHEIIGVVTHEMVHCYQYSSGAPGGLIEGISDFVRLKAGLAPPHWKGPKGELGEKWDAGYQKTAYFLNYLEEEHGSGTVGKINDTLRTEQYDEQHFWEGIFGKGNGIDVLWKAYRNSLDGEEQTSKTDEPKNVETETPDPQALVSQETAPTDTDEDDETVLVEREDMPRGMGGSVRRRPSS